MNRICHQTASSDTTHPTSSSKTRSQVKVHGHGKIVYIITFAVTQIDSYFVTLTTDQSLSVGLDYFCLLHDTIKRSNGCQDYSYLGLFVP